MLWGPPGQAGPEEVASPHRVRRDIGLRGDAWQWFCLAGSGSS